MARLPPEFLSKLALLDKVSEVMGQVLNCHFTIEANDPEALYKKVVLAAMVRSRRAFESFRLLLKQGLYEDAIVVLRSIFELVVHLKYIKADPIARAKRFLSYWFLMARRLEEGMKEAFKGAPEWLSEDQKALLNTKVAALKGTYADKNSWSDSRLRDMAKKVGMEFNYKILYRIHCQFVHPSPHMISLYLKKNGKGELSLESAPSLVPGRCTVPMMEACGYSIEIMKMGNEVLNLGGGACLEALQKDYATEFGDLAKK